MDLPAADGAWTRVRRGGAGQLVCRARHRARERGGDRRTQRGRWLPGGAQADAPVGAQDHRVCRPPARRPGAGRLAGQHARDAEELDRALARRRRRLSDRRSERQRPDLHHPARYAVRRHLHGAGARASAGRRADDARPAARGRRVPRRDRAQERPPAPGGLDPPEDRRLHRWLLRESGQRRADPGVDRRLRPDGLRHRRDHGRPRARSTRLRVRAQVRPTDRRGHPARDRRRFRREERLRRGRQPRELGPPRWGVERGGEARGDPGPG